jgi:predicted nucleic acid-binding protein
LIGPGQLRVTSLVDTDVAIDFLQGDPAAKAYFSALPADEKAAIGIITYIELYTGVSTSVDPPAAEQPLLAFLGLVEILELSMSVARRCAEIRADLLRRGRRIRARAFDLVIAATALDAGLILVTRNTADYQDIAGLQTRVP